MFVPQRAATLYPKMDLIPASHADPSTRRFEKMGTRKNAEVRKEHGKRIKTEKLWNMLIL
jgi:hypothetical protein